MYFFNDTSPTDIYTLSLHDALPIFLVVLAADHEVDVLVPGAHAGIPLAGTKAAVEVQLLAEREDRKSTRLNSSHANISYAVFCLKKIKTNGLHRRRLSHQMFVTAPL